MQTVQVYPIPALKDNYIWAIVSAEEAYVVDPGDSAPAIAFLESRGLSLKGILITHHHWDHTHGIEGLRASYDVPVVGALSSSLPVLTHRVQENDKVKLSARLPEFRVIEIPGHTLDHIAFYTTGMLFCGDTLFGAGCGRLFEGTGEMLYASLQKLAQLPPETQVYCAHEYTLLNLKFAHHIEPNNKAVNERLTQTMTMYEEHRASLPSSLELEKKTNPFLRCEDPLLHQAVEHFSQKKLGTPEDVFVALRRLKDNF